MDRDGGDEEHSVMTETGGDEVQDRTSDREGSWVGRVRSTTSVSQSISPSSSSSTINIPTGTDVVAGSHTWSAGNGMEALAQD